jgi:hypothetical protein
MRQLIRLSIACLTLALAACQAANLQSAEDPTTTPEVFIPLDKAIPEAAIALEGVHLQIAGTTLANEFPAGCTGGVPACTQAKQGTRIVAVTFAPRDLPEGNMLAYKNLPAVKVAVDGGTAVPASLTLYNNADHNLTIGFEVPADARTFALQWGDLADVPLTVAAQ